MKYINILINTEENYSRKVKYVFNTFCHILGLKAKFYTQNSSEEINIYYGIKKEKHYPISIFYNPDTAKFFSQKVHYPTEEVNFVKYKDEYIPFLFSKQGEILSFTSNSVFIRKDIVSSTFYFLSCWQEYTELKDVSQNRKFNYQKSIQYRYNFIEIPPVDRYCNILEDVLIFAFPGFLRKQIWEKGKSFTITLSHDIDYWNFWSESHLKISNKRKIKKIKKGSIKALLKLILQNLNKKFYSNAGQIKLLLKKEKLYKANSSFFLLSKSDFPDDRLNYFSDEKYFNQILYLLKDKSINLQGSKEAGFRYGYLEHELSKLNGFSANGYRARYLFYNYQTLFNLLEKSKIKYDTSIGFDEHIGYRAGISYPFYPFNIKENKRFNILEIPSILVDRTLFNQTGKNAKIARKLLTDILLISKKNHSLLSISWRNHVFDNLEFTGWGHIYWKLVKFGRINNAWICSLDELYNYWKDR